MTAYRIALFLHLLALMLAAGATAVTKLAAGRRQRARTVGEALDWHDVLTGASKLFPVSLVIFVLTGSYMLSVARIRVWSTGFVVAGLAGSALLFISGAFLGAKGKALRNVLANIANGGADRPAPQLVPPRLVAMLPVVNTGIAISVVFDMVIKPVSVPVALGVVAASVVVSLGGAMLGQRASAAKGAASPGAGDRLSATRAA